MLRKSSENSEEKNQADYLKKQNSSRTLQRTCLPGDEEVKDITDGGMQGEVL